MIPIADSPQARSFPYVNVAIILLNIAVFLYEVVLSQQAIRGNVTELDRFIADWGYVPACAFDAIGWEVREADAAICRGQPEPLLTLVSNAFLHGSWLHILGNMLFLWVFGDNVEDAMGHVRYAVFYFLTGIIAALSQGLIDVGSTTPSIGASGAVAAVMGAYIVLFPRATVNALIWFFPVPLPAFVVIGLWFLTDLFRGVASLGAETASGGIAYFAHIGGFVAGALLITLFMLGRSRPAISRRRMRRPGSAW